MEVNINNDYSKVVRRKIKKWYYNSEENLNKAVERIMSVRATIRELLEKVRNEVNSEEMNRGVNNVLRYLDQSGFYYRASSAHGHHNFPGGLAEHCLGVCNKALEMGQNKYPHKSLIISGLFHDICKADRFYFLGRRILHHRRSGTEHSPRSVEILKQCKFPLEPMEKNAIQWHMHYNLAKRHPFALIIFLADKKDVKRHK